LLADGVHVRSIGADLGDPETPARLAREAWPIDILMNDANTPSGGSLEGLDEAEWQRNWSVKPYGYIRMLRAFVPLMRERDSGVIINMIGEINQVATNKALFSAASCSSLTTITQALAHELAQCGVRILGVGACGVGDPRLSTKGGGENGRCRSLARIDGAPSTRACGRTSGNRRSRCVSRVRPGALYFGPDHQCRRRLYREQRANTRIRCACA